MTVRQTFPSPVALSVEAVSLTRGARMLFRELSARAEPGDFVVARGPNGSGKSSLLRLIAGLLRPHAGRVRLEGAEEASLATHYLGHLDALKGGLDAGAHARFWAELFGASAPQSRQAALARVGLVAIADLPARVLSQGQRRRLTLSRLLLAPRPLWLLDEPAAGLDASGKALLEALIAEHRAHGGIVVAALHEPLGPEPTAIIELGGA